VLGPRHPCTETAELLVSEIVSNSVLHSRPAGDGGMVTIVVDTGPDDADGVRVAVTDGGGATLPEVRLPPDDAESGRGMLLVDVLAADWGYEQSDDATTTWFELKPEAEAAGSCPAVGTGGSGCELRGRRPGPPAAAYCRAAPTAASALDGDVRLLQPAFLGLPPV
jgi:anti-sigma regulatory factor (Ser/Thr protein kinase)